MFEYRDTNSFLAPSGYFPGDLDHVDVQTVKERLQDDPYLKACYETSGGDGVRVLFRIPKFSTESEYYYIFDVVKQYVMDSYGLALDESRKDLAGLGNVGYDPDALLNETPQVFPVDWARSVAQSRTYCKRGGSVPCSPLSM